MNLSHGDGRLIVAACKKHGLLRNQCAYVLATANHETAGTMKPVRETLASTDAKAKERLTKAWKAGKMKWVTRDYWSGGFFGRGYVQLTHEENYRKAGQKLGVDLVGNPSKALDPDVAAEILVQGMRDGWFTGKKLADYITLSKSDYTGARRIVNGTDRADLIAGYAKTFDALLMAEGYGVEQQSPPAKPVPLASDRKPEPVAKSKRFWTWFGTAFAGGGGLSLSAFGALDWKVQMFLAVVVTGFAVYAITSMPAVRDALGLGK